MSSPPDTIEFACPSCGVKLKTAVANGGKRIRCKKCDQPLSIPEADLIEPELDKVFDDDSKPGDDPLKPLPEPGDPIEFDFDSEDIDTILARAKQAEAEEARLAEESKALKAQAEKLRREKIQKAKSAAKSPTAETGSPGTPQSKTEPAVAADHAPGEIPLPAPVDMPDVDGDELLTHVDEIAVPETGDATDREADLAPLQVEGITSDAIDVDDLYGVKCTVCDTRIHVTDDKVGTEIECPICYSPVRVTPPTEKTKYRPDWIQPEANDDAHENESDSEELKLSEPIERPKVEHNIEPGFGLPDVDEDLLAPLNPPAEQLEEPDSRQDEPDRVEKIPELQVVKESEPAVAEHPVAQRKRPAAKSKKVQNPSLPKHSVESQNMRDDDQTSRRARFAESQDEVNDEKPLSVHTSDDLQPLTIKSLNEHVVAMITDPRLIIPAVTAIIMLTVGDVCYDMFQSLRGPDAESGFGHAAKLVISALAFLAIYGCGTLILWYVCSVVFRESARGKHQVESWRSQGYDEAKSTFLLFACSFALAGLPFVMLRTFVSAPIRILIAPVLLLVAWFNQNAFIGVAFEPFATFRTQSESWKQFYIYVVALALLTLVGGLLFYVPYCSIIAATIIAVAAIAFAAATGWQVGRTVKMMEES